MCFNFLYFAISLLAASLNSVSSQPLDQLSGNHTILSSEKRKDLLGVINRLDQSFPFRDFISTVLREDNLSSEAFNIEFSNLSFLFIISHPNESNIEELDISSTRLLQEDLLNLDFTSAKTKKVLNSIASYPLSSSKPLVLSDALCLLFSKSIIKQPKAENKNYQMNSKILNDEMLNLSNSLNRIYGSKNYSELGGILRLLEEKVYFNLNACMQPLISSDDQISQLLLKFLKKIGNKAASILEIGLEESKNNSNGNSRCFDTIFKFCRGIMTLIAQYVDIVNEIVIKASISKGKNENIGSAEEKDEVLSTQSSFEDLMASQNEISRSEVSPNDVENMIEEAMASEIEVKQPSSFFSCTFGNDTEDQEKFASFERFYSSVNPQSEISGLFNAPSEENLYEDYEVFPFDSSQSFKPNCKSIGENEAGKDKSVYSISETSIKKKTISRPIRKDIKNSCFQHKTIPITQADRFITPSQKIIEPSEISEIDEYSKVVPITTDIHYPGRRYLQKTIKVINCKIDENAPLLTEKGISIIRIQTLLQNKDPSNKLKLIFKLFAEILKRLDMNLNDLLSFQRTEEKPSKDTEGRLFKKDIGTITADIPIIEDMSKEMCEIVISMMAKHGLFELGEMINEVLGSQNTEQASFSSSKIKKSSQASTDYIRLVFNKTINIPCSGNDLISFNESTTKKEPKDKGPNELYTPRSFQYTFLTREDYGLPPL